MENRIPEVIQWGDENMTVDTDMTALRHSRDNWRGKADRASS